MPCNCGKKKVAPTGSTQTAAVSDASSAQAGTSTPVRQSYTLTTTSGRTQTFGSKLEAEAARRRSGGGTVR